MALILTDEEIATFSRLPRAALTDLLKVIARMPHEAWGDLAAELEVSERRGLSGCVHQDLHHDSRGIVRDIESTAKRRRQGGRKNGASSSG